MSSDTASGRANYFDSLYKDNPDPWQYDTCDYEIKKRGDTLSFLQPHYANACEVGCSIGVLTEALAPLCDRLIGIDISHTAADIARHRLAARSNVEIKVLHVPYQDIDDQFDLLVFSEVLYFFSEPELDTLADFAQRRVLSNGDLLIVTYDGETQTHLNGRSATERFVTAALHAFDLIKAEQRQDYHVRLLRRRHEGS